MPPDTVQLSVMAAATSSDITGTAARMELTESSHKGLKKWTSSCWVQCPDQSLAVKGVLFDFVSVEDWFFCLRAELTSQAHRD